METAKRSSSIMDHPIVIVQQGAIRGLTKKTVNGKKYHSFEGVPYAQPPIGNLRFKAPLPPLPWIDKRDAIRPASKCAQINASGVFEGSEDCLYLNVYTPYLREKNRKRDMPVIFFVHGGRFINGYGDYYRPDYFLEQNVIVVTINYRLHILGFLCLDTPEVPGNAGLKDTVQALKWVHENISIFNGNPKNVIVFGESAGGSVVTSYLTSKMTEGLYSKVIAESGICLADLFMRQEDEFEKARYFVKDLGKTVKTPAEVLQVLVDTPVENLLSNLMLLEANSARLNGMFLPVIEKTYYEVQGFMTEDPWEVFRHGRIPQVPIILGVSSHDGVYFLSRIVKDFVYDNDLTRFIPDYLKMDKKSSRAINFTYALRRHYFDGAKTISKEHKTEYAQLATDAYIVRDWFTAAELIAKVNPHIYLFIFSYQGNLNTKVMKNLSMRGATHGDVLAYHFYRKSKADFATSEDEKIVKFFAEAFCNFAREGIPTWTEEQYEQWEPFSAKKRCLEVNTKFQNIPFPYKASVAFWQNLCFGRKSKL